MRNPFILPLLLGLAGCTTNMSNIEGPRANAIPTAYPWNSMIYAARTDAGVVLVDLGWQNAEDALRRGLAQIGARPEDVTDVFLTHSHRDHIAAWPLVRHARFHVGAGEDALFSGRAGHADSPSRLAEIGIGNPAPWAGEVNVRAFQRDTMFVLGADTVRAFVVPGHTAVTRTPRGASSAAALRVIAMMAPLVAV